MRGPIILTVWFLVFSIFNIVEFLLFVYISGSLFWEWPVGLTCLGYVLSLFNGCVAL